MALCTSADVRRVLGLDVEDAPDTTLIHYITWSDKMLLPYIATEVKGEQPTQSGNDSTLFAITGKPIADSNFDGTIDKSDVTIWGWTDSSDASTKVSLTISAVYATSGQFRVASDPGDTYETFTVDYWYYQGWIDTALLGLASAQLAAYLYSMRELALVPTTYSAGSLRMRFIQPWMAFWKAFLQTLEQIRKRDWATREAQEVAEAERTPLFRQGEEN